MRLLFTGFVASKQSNSNYVSGTVLFEAHEATVFAAPVAWVKQGDGSYALLRADIPDGFEAEESKYEEAVQKYLSLTVGPEAEVWKVDRHCYMSLNDAESTLQFETMI